MMGKWLSNLLKGSRDILLAVTLSRIEQANELEIDKLLKAIRRRYSDLFPDWEVIVFSLHRESEKRRDDVETLISFLRMHEK